MDIDIEKARCDSCGLLIVVNKRGRIALHNLGGWTRGAHKHALSSPVKCPGSLRVAS